MNAISPAPRALRVGGLMVALLLVTGVALSLLGRPNGDGTTTMYADFTDSSPLLAGNEVRLDGVKVGTIKAMRVHGDHARLTLELDRTALPVYANARLASRPVSILGERYVDLDPGTPEAKPLQHDSVIPVKQTSSATDLDQVLNVLDKPTSQSLAALVTTLGVGADANGKDIDAAIAALAPAMQDTQKLTSVLQDQNKTLASLVSSLEPVAVGLADDNGSSLDALVEATEQTLRTTTANEAAFRSMLQQMPGILRSAIITLTRLQGTADAAIPTLEGLQPTTQNLNEISKELDRFADAADPALKSATPVLTEAQKLIDAAQPAAAQLRRSGPDLTADSRSLDPLTQKLTKDFTAAMEFFKGWALTTNGRDGLGHYFRTGLVVTPYTATGYLPTSEGKRPPNPLDPEANPKSSKESGSLGGLLDGATNGVGGATDGLLSPKSSKDGGVTGLNQSQEQGVLGFLLGGN